MLMMMVLEILVMLIMMALIAAFIFDADKNKIVKPIRINENEGFRF